jgi:hypothetical protein
LKFFAVVSDETYVTLCKKGMLLAESAELPFLGGETNVFVISLFFTTEIVPASFECFITPEPFSDEVREGDVIHVATQVVAETTGCDQVVSVCDTAVALWLYMLLRHSVVRNGGEVVFFDINHSVAAVATSMILTFGKVVYLSHEVTPCKSALVLS